MPDRAGRTIRQRLQALGIDSGDVDADVHAALDQADQLASLVELGASVFSDVQVQIATWTRKGAAAAAPEQVHVIIRLAGLNLIVRFDRGAQLDAFIAALTQHRAAVFGPPPPPLLTLLPGGGKDV